MEKTPVIDLFSGPGGLGEGFSVCANPSSSFDVCLSVEKEVSAAETLLLRKFFRRFKGDAPDDYYSALRGEISLHSLYSQYPAESRAARRDVLNEELGENEFTRIDLHQEITDRLGDNSNWVLIGGPPCQAYSVAGKARNKGKQGYVPEEDHRHYLYEEYLRVIGTHWPVVFIMENVPGLLSTKIGDDSMFEKIKIDLEDPSMALSQPDHPVFDGYRIFSLVERSSQLHLFEQSQQIDARGYVVESENYGIPQARHRVILVGIRTDISNEPDLLTSSNRVTTEEVIGDLPKLRSGLSTDDSPDRWEAVVRSCVSSPWWGELKSEDPEICVEIEHVLSKLTKPRHGRGKPFLRTSRKPKALAEWYLDPKLDGVCNHEARSHMDSDIHRYLFASSLVSLIEKKKGRRSEDVSGAIQSKLEHFPESLLPDHRNVRSIGNIKRVHFANRFQVQRAKAPSSTVVSHIAKDGHYFIHYDSCQCRSLTVREAARLQTFPDNYLFCGNRTQQFTQVGNAVPPLLAKQIAEIVMKLLNG